MREPVPHRASDVVALVGLVLATIGLPGAAAGQEVAWPAYAADAAVTKYSPLDQINRDTIADVEIVWRRPVILEVTRQGNMTRGPLLSQNTPLMVGGLLYVSTGLGSVAALDATTGSGISRRFITVSGTTTSRRRPISWTSRSTDARSKPWPSSASRRSPTSSTA